MLKFISRKYETVPLGILNKYSSANKFNDMLDAFNDRVVSVLNMYITNYLSKEGIKMRLDDNTSVVINNSGQFNLANDNATINATQNNGIKAEDFTQLIDSMRGQFNNQRYTEQWNKSRRCHSAYRCNACSSC